MMGPRDHVHEIVDELPDEDVRIAERFLEFLRTGTDEAKRLRDLEDRIDAADSREALAEPGGIPYSELRQRLGLA